MKNTQEFLNTLTHQEKVNLAFQLIDYIAEELYSDGNIITIVTNEYTTEEDVDNLLITQTK
jgi:uridylate kinase